MIVGNELKKIIFKKNFTQVIKPKPRKDPIKKTFQ